MMKKLFALLLAAVMLLGAGATALAAEPEGAGYVISIANSSTTNSLTVDLLTWEGMKNGRLELTYPEELTLVSARSTLDAENGITDLDASKPGTVHFAWAAYTAQKDGTPVLRLTFRGGSLCCAEGCAASAAHVPRPARQDLFLERDRYGDRLAE